VQGVKIDGAAAMVIDRRCCKMIQIYDHGKQHYQPGLQPDFPECQMSHDARDNPMQTDMQ
jgi:hypothetical protein